ncbi:MAG TPA: multicopper oxidase domain-containing protein, partial [Mycobacterium sp.]|nr:multicopper oxidase domain-containing protein [Mycobacterium sp.]
MNRHKNAVPIGSALSLIAVLSLFMFRRLGDTSSGGPAVGDIARDFPLAAPLVILAAYPARRAAERTVARMRSSGFGALLVQATWLAVATSVAMALNSQPRLVLFGPDGQPPLPPAVAAMRDGLLVFAPVLAAAMILLTAQRLLASSIKTRQAALVFISAAALSAVSMPTIASAGPSAPAPAARLPGSACPVDAPQKTFDVQAIDVKIPLNRYGDNDPHGRMYALTSEIGKIRAEEISQQVSIGLRDDPIQPLVVRANLGDCVIFHYQNNAAGGSFGMHIDGLAFTTESSGDNIGNNTNSAPPTGGSATYQFYIPSDPTLEGSHYIHPGPGNRSATDHGLFGALVAEPAGSTYRNPSTGNPQVSGWEADILLSTDKAFREAVEMLHQVGNDNERINDKNGAVIDAQDKTTGSYLPGSFAINYRSEPFKNRVIKYPTEKSHAYGSYTFGDPATPMPRGYLADPTKFRVMSTGAEKFHVYHLHGGGDRWRVNPHADSTYDYAATGLMKDPPTIASPSQRIDSQSMGPGESYDMEIEGGAGGVQQSVGDFLYHCHIAKHYVSGMWGLWRVFNTRQQSLLALPDRVAPPSPVDARGLIGKTMPDGTKLTAANLDSWIRPQLPPQGAPKNTQDPAVWNWTVDANGNYLGEPEDLTL